MVMDKEKSRLIDILILEGKPNRDVARIAGCGLTTVTKHRGNLAEYLTCHSSSEKMCWLMKNWGWSGKLKELRAQPPKYTDDGYRIVRVGEKSNFYTPYRPDGVWR